jgi:hypothetical protein
MKEVLSLITWHPGIVHRYVLCRLEAGCRHCSDWAEQARLLQHERFADPRLRLTH